MITNAVNLDADPCVCDLLCSVTADNTAAIEVIKRHLHKRHVQGHENSALAAPSNRTNQTGEMSFGLSDTQAATAKKSGKCRRVGRKHLETWFRREAQDQQVTPCRSAKCHASLQGSRSCPSTTLWDYKPNRYPPFLPTARCLRTSPIIGQRCQPVPVHFKVLVLDESGCRHDKREQWAVGLTTIYSHCEWVHTSTMSSDIFTAG